ncbi:phosphoribosylanthranilate isomerase [Paludibacter propionicigenes WB4]|uniref:N-(5'-phosphoribosyl)anthranilate isomerase n=1 Tax=Paludibacter propionicigenes (strain DSM 17365 / JCM 13257 / WB4) TaxID=694427 RepID=E4T8I0_PALPW|nr:phosphoribosylanthranilate isomerase [Paludibacter propionicigenes]ADQ81024.1 phosphoribosylanthranilate isomerase [Paludibacter propionicigenes WB4]
MKIKICGMKIPENIYAIAELKPDFMGFIFYPKSPRYAEPLDMEALKALPRRILKIGVFVNASLDDMLTAIKKYALNGVQLHGTESEDICYTLKMAGLLVFKAFPVAEVSDFDATDRYEGTCDFFLFDTKTKEYGGSGVKFDWRMLESYKGETAFLLSGGISADDADAIRAINHPKFTGIDLNSKFEVEPGLKDIDLLKSFLKEIGK